MPFFIGATALILVATSVRVAAGAHGYHPIPPPKAEKKEEVFPTRAATLRHWLEGRVAVSAPDGKAFELTLEETAQRKKSTTPVSRADAHELANVMTYLDAYAVEMRRACFPPGTRASASDRSYRAFLVHLDKLAGLIAGGWRQVGENAFLNVDRDALAEAQSLTVLYLDIKAQSQKHALGYFYEEDEKLKRAMRVALRILGVSEIDPPSTKLPELPAIVAPPGAPAPLGPKPHPYFGLYVPDETLPIGQALATLTDPATQACRFRSPLDTTAPEMVEGSLRIFSKDAKGKLTPLEKDGDAFVVEGGTPLVLTARFRDASGLDPKSSIRGAIWPNRSADPDASPGVLDLYAKGTLEPATGEVRLEFESSEHLSGDFHLGYVAGPWDKAGNSAMRAWPEEDLKFRFRSTKPDLNPPKPKLEKISLSRRGKNQKLEAAPKKDGVPVVAAGSTLHLSLPISDDVSGIEDGAVSTLVITGPGENRRLAIKGRFHAKTKTWEGDLTLPDAQPGGSYRVTDMIGLKDRSGRVHVEKIDDTIFKFEVEANQIDPDENRPIVDEKTFQVFVVDADGRESELKIAAGEDRYYAPAGARLRFSVAASAGKTELDLDGETPFEFLVYDPGSSAGSYSYIALSGENALKHGRLSTEWQVSNTAPTGVYQLGGVQNLRNKTGLSSGEGFPTPFLLEVTVPPGGATPIDALKKRHPLEVGEAMQKKIGGLIRALGAPVFRDRESATKALYDLSGLAVPQMRKAMAEESDPEISRRLSDLLARARAKEFR